ncbi:MAG: DUF3422 domain-containing protein [Boseongicola sp.]|nr:DUF3422 domain-containing protein [Boseongicola sp.]
MDDHPLRYRLVNELHTRPFPVLEAPSRAAFLAIKPESNAASRDRSKDLAHLIELLDRFGAPHPQPGATHYFGEIGKHKLKWECHTEFVTYTLFGNGVAETPFDAATFNLFPQDWLDNAPGVRMTSALIRIEQEADHTVIADKIDEWFVAESLAASRVLDDSMVIAGDFRLDHAGHMRFALFADPNTGSRRIGRVVQRICEIETYKTMSMLGLSRVQEIGPQLGQIDGRLTELIGDMRDEKASAETTLDELLGIASELENLSATSSFRLGATGAYEAIVNQRTEILREERFGGCQTFAEFMMRRYDPAMRTVKSTEARLKTLGDRAWRAGDLLRTRVDVERSAQNQSLLESMDRRADLQLRLQRTVEGLSVVAISYYAVNLAVYMLGPVGTEVGVSKLILTALVTPIVILLVWILIQRIRKDSD